ncbi:MAG: hypothetical protein ABR95_13310 [Sphingobacteriales bacterium BACL12 MAG-120813-bin55]|jgi:putative endonuclease|nr:MAG: hypothetical protein ABR94_07085 [Sphingobacteriales bacterium BACL12 MAG-120802-bin5]KRP12502.1 MAG: hypothetical protein ABR95_13310 [Sphingobacteriales bacterium BACL12 MAG-120813-bin55]
MSNHLETGKTGEQLAADFLEREGYTIVATNWKSGRAELDIIAHFKNTLVIVEVKTRSSESLLVAEAAVNARKRALMVKAAGNYIYESNWMGECRFDVIAVELRQEGAAVIRHFEDVFYPNPTDEL